KDARSGEQLTFLMNAPTGQKVAYGRDLASYMRVAGQDARNAVTLRWMRTGRLAAIFKDTTQSLKVTKLQLFMDVVSNLLGVASNINSDTISPALQRGLRMSLIQNQKVAPFRPDPPGYAFYADPGPNADYPNPFNL